MSRKGKKKKSAYLRGYRDSMKDQEEFLDDLERNLYSIVLSIETSPTTSINHIVNQINIARDAITEFKESVFGTTDENNNSMKAVTILDLQLEDNNPLDDIDNEGIVDDEAVNFLTRREVKFASED